jgi:hypothetical protein
MYLIFLLFYGFNPATPYLRNGSNGSQKDKYLMPGRKK